MNEREKNKKQGYDGIGMESSLEIYPRYWGFKEKYEK